MCGFDSKDCFFGAFPIFLAGGSKAKNTKKKQITNHNDKRKKNKDKT